jgi:RNA polymerase sigma factor (sigma-70 family)
VEASTLQAPATLARPRVSIPTPLLRFRSDDQLVALFRAGHDEAFRAIHDRYHKRLFAYARQMLPARQDAEDALQDVFVRAYSGLRASDRDLALRAWLFRVAHNRCIDELRRPAPPAPEVLQLVRSVVHDPVAEADMRESLRRLIDDVRRLPDQQRSALLLRELGGMSYAELAASLGISVGAVKSLLVRARIALAQAATARDTACSEIHEALVEAYERGLRPNANARRHMRDCAGCRGFRRELRGVNRRLAAIGPAVGPLGLLTKVLGLTGGAGGGATAGGATAGGAALVGGTGVAAGTGGAFLGAGHVATLIAAAVATAGGAVEIQHTISTPSPRAPAHVRVVPKHAHRYAAPSEPPAPPPAYAPANFESTQATISSQASDVTRSKIVALERVKPIKSALRSGGPNGTGGGAMFGPQTTSTGTTSATTGTNLPTTAALIGEGTSKGTGDSSGSSSTSSGTGGSTTSNTSTSSTSSTGGSSTGGAPGSTSTTTGGSASSTSGATSSGTSSTSSSSSGSGSTSTASSSGSGSPVPPN